MPYRSVFSPGLFNERTIIVTGGGSGIGRCTAHELASLGAHCVLIGRSRDKLERTVTEITEVDGRGESELAVKDRDDKGSFIESAGEFNRRVELFVAPCTGS